jgi:hypothetical protein
MAALAAANRPCPAVGYFMPNFDKAPPVIHRRDAIRIDP